MTLYTNKYHLVECSPWPIFSSLACLILTTGITLYSHSIKLGGFTLFLGLVSILLVMFTWWRDIIREASFEGRHTLAVQRGLKLGVIFFILSEVMFFSGFFWAFFHSSLAPSIELGAVWPPVGIIALNPFEVPLVNTAILLSSGATITVSHHAIVAKNRSSTIWGLILTVLLGAIFTILQGMEYYQASFDISSSVYGSVFFVATGFHGLHVNIGAIFIGVILIRTIKYHYTSNSLLGFESAAYYWHFVDVVWLLLFATIYWWGW